MFFMLQFPNDELQFVEASQDPNFQHLWKLWGKSANEEPKVFLEFLKTRNLCRIVDKKFLLDNSMLHHTKLAKLGEEPGPTKCIVKNCEHVSKDGPFVGEICMSCYNFLLDGRGKNNQIYRNVVKEVAATLKERLDSDDLVE
jgi:hypothetical protein